MWECVVKLSKLHIPNFEELPVGHLLVIKIKTSQKLYIVARYWVTNKVFYLGIHGMPIGIEHSQASAITPLRMALHSLTMTPHWFHRAIFRYNIPHGGSAHSKWLEVFCMKTITFFLLLVLLQNLFAKTKLPEQAVTDNAPQKFRWLSKIHEEKWHPTYPLSTVSSRHKWAGWTIFLLNMLCSAWKRQNQYRKSWPALLLAYQNAVRVAW